jgi:hypothetical protein
MSDTTTDNVNCNCTAGNFSTNCVGNTTTTVGCNYTIISNDYQCRNCGFIFIPKNESEIVCPKCTSNAVGQISRPVYIYPQYIPYYPPYYTYPSYPPYYITYTSGTYSGAAISSTTGNLNITGNCEIKST